MKPSKKVSLSESVLHPLEVVSSKALPWSPSCVEIMGDMSRMVQGTSTSRKCNGPLRKHRPIPSYDFQQRFYRVVGDCKTEPPPLNHEFETLLPVNHRAQLSNTKPDISHEELSSWEAATRRSRLVSSSMDWQLATGLSVVNQLDTDTDKNPEITNYQGYWVQLLSH